MYKTKKSTDSMRRLMSIMLSFQLFGFSRITYDIRNDDSLCDGVCWFALVIG